MPSWKELVAQSNDSPWCHQREPKSMFLHRPHQKPVCAPHPKRGKGEQKSFANLFACLLACLGGWFGVHICPGLCWAGVPFFSWHSLLLGQCGGHGVLVRTVLLCTKRQSFQGMQVGERSGFWKKAPTELRDQDGSQVSWCSSPVWPLEVPGLRRFCGSVLT